MNWDHLVNEDGKFRPISGSAPGVKGQKGVSVKGDKGAPAPLISYQGNVADLIALNAIDTTSFTGGETFYIEDGSNLYYSWDGSAWRSAGQAVKGQAGVKGQTGDKGLKGENGEKGQKGIGEKGQKGVGDKGDKGTKGSDGSSASLPAVVLHASWDASAGNSFAWATDQIASYGIANVVRTAVGIFDITFTTAMASANYTVVASAGDRNYSGVGSSPRSVNILNRTANGFTAICERTDDANQDDCGYIAFVVLGPV